MKKLLYLLPFLILNFCFSIGISFMEYDLTSRNHTLIESNAVLWVDKYKNGSEFCAYTLKSENLKQSSIGFNGDEGNYFTNYFGTPPDISADFSFVYHFLRKYTENSNTYYAYELYEPKINCSSWKFGSCVSGRNVCVYCDPIGGSYFNSDTGSCDTNCDLIPNLKFRSDCQCKKAGLGGFVSSVSATMLMDDPISHYCSITCENGNLNLDLDFCYIDDTIKNTDEDCPEGGTSCGNGNDDNNNNNNDDDNSTGGGSSSGNIGGNGGGGDYDYCKTHPEICYPDNNNSGGNTGGGGSTGGNTGGGNNGGNNNNDNDPNGHETTPSGGDNPPSDDTGDDDGECKGDECNVDYGGIDDLNNAVSDGINKITGIFDDAKGSVIGVYDTIKKGGLSDFRSSCGGNCGRVFYFELPNKRIPIEINLCEITDNFKSVLYLIFYALFVTIFSIAIFKFVARLI